MWKYIRKYLIYAVIAGLFMIGEVMMDLIQPGIMSRIVDEGVLGLNNGGASDLRVIWTLGLQMLGLVLFGGLCDSLNNAFVHISSQNIGNEIRKDCFHRIMAFSFPQLDRFGTGSLVTRMTNDITQVQAFVSVFVRGMIRTSLLTFGSMYFMFRLNRSFGLIVLCVFPFLVGIIAFCLWKANPLFSKLQAQLDAINAVMQEDVSGIRIIKACVREGYEKLRFGRANNALIQTQLKTLVIFAFMNPLTNALMYVAVAVILLAGSYEVGAGSTTPGIVMAALTYTTQLLNGILMLVMLFQNIPGMMSRNSRFAEAEHADHAGAAVRRIVTYFMHEKVLVIGMLAIVVFGTLCSVYAPSLQSRAVDIIAGERSGNLSHTLFFMLSVYLLYSACGLLQGLCSAHLSQHVVKRMREELFGKIVDLPIRYLDTHSHGDVMSRMTNDIENISTTISQSLPSLFSGVLTIAGTVTIMLWYCWQLALLSLVTVLLTVLATKFLSGKVRRFSRRRQMLLGQLNGIVEEMVSGYRTVVAYNHQDITTEEFCATADSLTKAGIRTDIFSGVMGPVMNCIGNIGFVIIAVFGGYFSVNGLISVGVISAFIVYAKQFGRPINEIAQIYGQLQTAIASAERVFTVLDEKDEDKSGGTLVKEREAAITFKDVSFSYEKGKPVIQNFTLTVPSGRKVALVGATGSGKTTIVNLLMRFYETDGGEICINRQNIRDVARDSLRRHVAIVLQDTVLFSDTVRNNLKYGNDAATDEQLAAAAEMSQCREMIRLLPRGYDTVLTGSGANISQGQRQLLAIARAFVADPEILILDEATSNVDTRTEKAIQDAMQHIMQGRTSIVIAHRLSMIRDSDIIVVMDHGEIVESGGHETLLAQKGKYYELYMTQYAGFAT